MTAPRWPLYVAGLAALAWLALAVAMVIALREPAGFPPRLIIAGTIALALAAPVAVIALVAMRLRDSRAADARGAQLLADSAWATDHRIDEAGVLLAGVEARVAALVVQLEGITGAIAAHDTALSASTARLNGGAVKLGNAAAAASDASQALADRLPAATAQAGALQALLADTEHSLESQLRRADTLLEALGRGAETVVTATTTAAGHISGVNAAAETVAAALRAPIAELETAGSVMLDRTVAATDAARAGLADHAAVLDTTLKAARADLAAVGTDAAASVAAEIATLQAAVATLDAAIAAQADRYALFIQQLERGFGTLDSRLAASAVAGQAELDRVASGMVAARDAVQALSAPIAGTSGAVDHLLSLVAGMARNTSAVLAALDSALPAAEPRVAALVEGLDALHANATALAVPIAAAGDAVAATRETLVAVETQAGGTALAAAAQLVDAFTRVRDIAGQTAGTMRATLADVVGEAETALAEAGTRRAETAFAAPVRAAIAEITTANLHAADAAQAAAERVTQRLLALAGTIATVEARTAEAEDRHGAQLRADIATRSATLLASMEAASIDIAQLLAGEIDEGAWAKWLGGERGMFLRRAVRLVDAATTHDLARLWQTDSSFREAATRFIGEFEALIARVSPEREGRSLALALLSSDAGKLYIALSQATERLQ